MALIIGIIGLAIVAAAFTAWLTLGMEDTPEHLGGKQRKRG